MTKFIIFNKKNASAALKLILKLSVSIIHVTPIHKLADQEEIHMYILKIWKKWL